MDLNKLIFDTWSVLAQSLIFGIALALAVRVTLSIFAPVNASTRFAAWFATLIAIAIVPPAFLLKTAIPGIVQRVNRSERSTASPAAAESKPRYAVRPATDAGFAGPPPAHSSFQPRTAFQAELLMPIEAASGVLLVYGLLAAGLLFGRLGFSYLRLRRLKAGAAEAPPEVLCRFENWRSLCRTSRPVRLVVSSRAQSPMAVGFRRPAVIIPDSLLLTLTGEELDHLGMHELAHIRRYDDWTNLAQRIIQAVLFFHPAVHWICRRLEFEREVACDDWVLTLTGEARPYARSLAKMVECAPWQRGPALASGVAFRKPQILRRIEMLLDGSRNSKPGISQVTFVLILLCVFGAVSEIVRSPALVAFRNDPGGSLNRSRWTMDGRTIETEFRGKIEFDDEDAAVRAISPGGYLRVMENDGTRRQLEMVPGNSAQPEVHYFVNGREAPMDDKARQWARGAVGFIIRENGIDAEARALRILEKRGASGVFEEIDAIMSDHSRRRYLSAVIKSGSLDVPNLRRAMNRVSRISSDHEKSELLMEAASYYEQDALLPAYFDVVNTIHSDHDRSRVLSQMLKESGSNSAVLALAARSVEQMSSDHDKAQLMQLAAAEIDDSEARRGLMRATASINSDHDKGQVISAMLSGGPLPAEALEDVLQVAATIQSDHDKAQVLGLAVQQDLKPRAVTAAFFAAIKTINSDNDKAGVLNTFIQRGFDEGAAAELAGSIEQMSSDNDKANLLVSLAPGTTSGAFASAVGSIHSDGDKRRVLEAMVKRGDSVEVPKSALALAAAMNSDHDKTQVLVAIADKYRDNAEIRDAVRKAADKIPSDSDYRRIVSRLFADSGKDSSKQPE